MSNKYLTVIVNQSHPELNSNESESIKIKRNEIVGDVKHYFEKQIKNLECDNCKKNSKGKLIFNINTENGGVGLYCESFCCYDFQLKTNKVFK